MIKRPLFVSIAFALLLTGCAMMQSIVKSTFPYTATLTVSAASKPGNQYTAVSMATSFDQDFSSDGNNATKISGVRIISAKLRAIDPTDYNIGNMVSVKFYMSKPDGTDEVLVASRTDITEGVGNNIVLDIDNTHFLDQLIRQPNVHIRMVYVLRNNISVDANLRLVLGLSAYPNN